MFARHTSAEMLYAEAEKRGLTPRWETRDGLFSFEHGGRNLYVYYAKLHANSQLGSQICADKSLTHAFLEREGYPNIPYCYTADRAALNAFFDRHHPLVQKPLLGMRSKGVRLISARDEMDLSAPEDTLFERYVEGDEYRCLILGSTVGMQRKTADPAPDHPWRKHIENLPPGARRKELSEIAESIAAKLHMRFMAVDFILQTSGALCILELNSMPGLHSFHHPDSGEAVDAAALLLEDILRAA